jgi:hypothetical protein
MMHRLLVTSSTILCVLVVMTYPCKGQDAIRACVKSDGTIRILLSPSDSCKIKNEVPLTLNTPGPTGPEGPPGPPLPRWLGFNVDCDHAGSINDALAHQAESITVSISGTCYEAVVINRDHVILQATDPGSPPILIHEGTPVSVSRARDVSLLNLKITGSPFNNGVMVSNSHVTVESCEIWNKGSGMLMEGPSVVDIRNSQIHNNGTGISVGAGGVLTIDYTNVEHNNGAGIGVIAATVHTVRSGINHNGLGIQLGHGAAAILELSDVSWNTPGEGIGAGSSSIHMSDSKLTNNGVAGIWGESTDVMLYGGNEISNNQGGGIALTAGSSLTSRDWTGQNVIKDNRGCGLAMIVSSFAIGGGIKIQQPTGCAISCDTALAICDRQYITGTISGCGPKCQR